MDITLPHPRFFEAVKAPTSEGAAQRAMIAAALADKPTELFADCQGTDLLATVRCLKALGADISELNHPHRGYRVVPLTHCNEHAVADCGESASTLRFLLPVAAALGATVCFLCHGKLLDEPMEPILDELNRHNISITQGNDGSLTVNGRLYAGEYRIHAGLSSQFATGLLFALSLLEGNSILTLESEIESPSSIDMTLSALAAFGVNPQRAKDGRTFLLSGRTQASLTSPQTMQLEGDFSLAAFPLAAGAVGHDPVTVTGLSPHSSQGECAILDILKLFGALVEIDEANGSVTVSPRPMVGCCIDAHAFPTLVPAIAMIALAAIGDTEIFGVACLRLGNTDVLAATAALIKKLGGKVTQTLDGLHIEGRHSLLGGVVSGAGDPRIVMSAAVASLRCHNPVTVSDAETVAEIFPDFFSHFIS